MTGGVLTILGLLVGVLLAFAGGEALTRGARRLFAGTAGVAGLAAVICSALPEYAFAMRASAIDLSGAAVGAVAGSLTANAFLAAVISSSNLVERARGTMAFGLITVTAAVLLIVVAFDGYIGRVEGGLMLAAALIAAWQAMRIDHDPEAPKLAARPGPGLAWLAFGLVLLLGGAWLALEQVRSFAIGLPDGDLIIGLSVLGLGAALPETMAAIAAMRRGEGAQSLLNVLVGVSLVLFGALGAAALVKPLKVADSFLRAPLVGVSASAVLLLVLAFRKKALPRAAPAVGAIVYLAFLVAFLKAGG
jgi:cation:H+ antiporter